MADPLILPTRDTLAKVSLSDQRMIKWYEVVTEAVRSLAAEGITTADFDPAALRLSTEGVASPLDTEVGTAAWVAAYVTAAIGTIPTTVTDADLDTGAATAAGITWVGLRTAGLAVGAVGSYAMLTFNANTTASAGSTHAGSGLSYSNASATTPAGTPSGTWRLMGRTVNTLSTASTSLFLRIS